MAIRVVTELDPSGVQKGAATVNRSLNDLNKAADRTEKSIADVGNVSGGQYVKGTTAATKANKALTAGFQNASYQVGDFFVQIASGTDGIRAASQQIPQLVQGFGLLGAGLSVVVAVAGAAYQIFHQNVNATKDLENALKSLNAVVDTTAQGTTVLTGSIEQLARVSRDAAQLELTRALVEARAALDNANKSATEILGTFGTFTLKNAKDELDSITSAANESGRRTIAFLASISRGRGSEFPALGANTDRLAKQFKITRKEAAGLVLQFAQFQKSGAARDLQQLTTSTTNLAIAQDKPNKKLVEFVNAIVALNTQVTEATDKQRRLTEMLNNFDASLKDNTSTAETHNASLRSLSQQIAAVRTEHIRGERAAAQMQAALSLGTEATAEQIAEARRLAGVLYDEQKALADKKQADQDAEAATKRAATEEANRQKQIAALNQQLATARVEQEFGARAAAQYAAAMKLGSGATQEQRDAAAAAAAALYDQAEATKAAAQAEQLRKQVQSLQTSIGSPLEQIQAQETQRLEILQKARDADVLSQQDYEALKTQVAESASRDRQALALTETQNTLSATANGFEALSQIAGQFIGNQDNANKTALRAQKAFAIAASSLNLAVALGQALADPSALTIYQKLANYATVASAFGGIISTVQSSNFATGGYVVGAGTGTSDSIPANLSNGEFVVNARDTARNRPALEAMNRGGTLSTEGGNVYVNNYGSGVTATATRDTNGDTYVTIQDVRDEINSRAPQLMANEARNPNSRFNASMRDQYDMRRR